MPRVSAASGTESKACQLLPASELQAAYGAKITDPHGTDGESSMCTANIGGLAVKLQTAAPGASGVPTSISQGLVGARLMLSQARQSAQTNTEDFGRVGCLLVKMKKGFDGKSLSKPLLTTSCFLVDGGYLNLSIASEEAKQVKFEVVKGLLEKAAARR